MKNKSVLFGYGFFVAGPGGKLKSISVSQVAIRDLVKALSLHNSLYLLVNSFVLSITF